ncbi:MAG: hypothetical protein AB7V56_11560 [Candidatus Nitrosocosmicus sp.]
MLLGAHLTLLIGKIIPTPVPFRIVESIQSVKISQFLEKTHFEIIVSAGRGKKDIFDIPAEYNLTLKEFNRVIIIATLGIRPFVLVDGIIKSVQYNPSEVPGQSSYTVTGSDISDILDIEEKSKTYPMQNEFMILARIVKDPRYLKYNIIPFPPPFKPTAPPIDLEKTPTQSNVTDYQYLKSMAKKLGFIFTIEPADVPGTNFAYMGPAVDEKLKLTPLEPINFNMGVFTNTSGNMSFDYDSSKPADQVGYYLDIDKHLPILIQTIRSPRPPLSLKPAFIVNMQDNRKEKFMAYDAIDYYEALKEAQARKEHSSTDLLTAEVQVDTLRYGQILRPRRFVPVTGVGLAHSGLYYIKKVEHEIIPKKKYTQTVTLTRDGKGSNIPVVNQSGI